MPGSDIFLIIEYINLQNLTLRTLWNKYKIITTENHVFFSVNSIFGHLTIINKLNFSGSYNTKYLYINVIEFELSLLMNHLCEE
jgi:hypothetical protein